MEKKFLTFDEQNRKDYLKSVFTVLFVVGCAVTLSQALFTVPLDVMFGGVKKMTPFLSCIKIVLSYIYQGVAIYLPFLVYIIIKKRSPGRLFVKREPGATAVQAILSVVMTACAGVAVFIAVTYMCDSITDAGYIITESYIPAIMQGNLPSYIVFVISSALIPALFQELTYRGTVIKELVDDSPFFAVAVAVVICSCSHISLRVMPVVFVSAILLGWVFVKTRSAFVTYTANAVMNGLLAVLWVLKELSVWNYTEHSLVMLAVVCCLFVLSFVFLFNSFKKTKQEKSGMSSREGCNAFFGSFALWILIILTVIRVFAFCISKPKPQTDAPDIASDAQEQT